MIDLETSAILPEQRLFVGVIVNAAQEAAIGMNTGSEPTKQCATSEAARTWFMEGGEDFETVCSFAGLEPDRTRTRVLAYLERVASDPQARAIGRRANMRHRNRGVSMPDVARRAGVSPTTVSNVIKNRPHVTPATPARVVVAINELGYTRHDH